MWTYLLNSLLRRLRLTDDVVVGVKPAVHLPQDTQIPTDADAHSVDVSDSDRTHPLSTISTSSSSPDSCPDTPATEVSTLFPDEGSSYPPSTRPQNERFILVTGGLGYIGSHTTLELLKSGYNVLVVDDLSNSYVSVYHRIQSLANEHHAGTKQRVPAFLFYAFDYRDTTALRALLDAYVENPLEAPPSPSPDPAYPTPSNANPASPAPPQTRSRILGTIHFAAHKAVHESLTDPLPYYANNVSGLITLLTTLTHYGIKTLVFSSSATVYGSLAERSSAPLSEDLCVHQPTPLPPTSPSGAPRVAEPGSRGLTSPYGRTKWMCEAILSDLCVADPTWTVAALRYFNPIGCDPSGRLGEDPRGTPSNLMPVVARVLAGERPALEVYGTDYPTRDGTAVRDFIHVVDLARGHVAALERAVGRGGLVREGGCAFRAFNLGSGTGHSVREVVGAMERASGRKIRTRAVGRRPGDVASCVAATGRAEGELGWRTERGLDVCARDCWGFLERSGRK